MNRMPPFRTDIAYLNMTGKQAEAAGEMTTTHTRAKTRAPTSPEWLVSKPP